MQRGYSPAFFPLGELIPRRTTPEVRYLFAELGARMPYREASRVLQICGFDCVRTGRMTIWRHTIAIGTSINVEQNKQATAIPDNASPMVRKMSVGIDDTYIRHFRRDAGRQIQVTGGRIERNGKLAERFAFVSSAPGWTPDQFEGLLRQYGLGSGTSIRVISDGDDGLRNFVEDTISKNVTQQLDWFHIGMRLARLRQVVHLPMSYTQFLRNPDAFKPLERRVSRIRDALWRGQPGRALIELALLKRDAREWIEREPDRFADVPNRLDRAISEFQGYISGSRRAQYRISQEPGPRGEGYRLRT